MSFLAPILRTILGVKLLEKNEIEPFVVLKETSKLHINCQHYFPINSSFFRI